MRRGVALTMGGVMAVLIAVLVLVFVLRLAGRPDTKVKLGEDVFEVGKAAGVEAAIRTGGPLLFHDPLGRGRDVVVDRVGGRFVAYSAPEQGCALAVDRQRLTVRDCHGATLTYDPARTPSYAVHVDDSGKLTVDLRRPVGTTTTTG